VYDHIWQSPLKRGAVSYQRGSLKKVKRKEGEIWVLRYRVTNSDGRRVENIMPIGLVQRFPKGKDAWREADRLGLSVRINDTPAVVPSVSFHFLAEHYLKAEFGVDALRPKSINTTSHVEQVVRAYLVPRFGTELAEDVKPLDIQRWLKSLHDSNRLAWPTISKMRGIMHRIYKIGILHEHVAKNPVLHVETRSKSDYKAIVITPAQTLAILKALPSLLHFPLATRVLEQGSCHSSLDAQVSGFAVDDEYLRQRRSADKDRNRLAAEFRHKTNDGCTGKSGTN
jgi:hypothetical protein